MPKKESVRYHFPVDKPDQRFRKKPVETPRINFKGGANLVIKEVLRKNDGEITHRKDLIFNGPDGRETIRSESIEEGKKTQTPLFVKKPSPHTSRFH